MPRLERLVALALAAGLAAAGAPLAQTAPGDRADPRQLHDIEARIKREREVDAELQRRHQEIREEVGKLRERLVHSAQSTQRREAVLTRYERELGELEAREAATAKNFARHQQQLAEVLAALQRISLKPPLTLASRTGDANDAVRGALLLRGLVPELERKARDLRDRLAGFAALKAAVRQGRGNVAVAGSELDRERQRLQELLERKQALLRETAEEQARLQARLAALTEEAKTLRELIARVERQAKDERLPAAPRTAALTEPPQLRSFAAARGTLTLPAAGRLVPRFGSDEKLGEFSKGLVVESRPGAQAVSPYDGQVVFAGPFRGYGRILILEHRDGYHTLIVGLGRIDVAVKQWVLAGEPIGAVGEIEAQGPQLYIEIRHNGRPIDPAKWFAPRPS
jgi:septal ring factor EnvC (AmiA/AmiB activator)